MTNISCVICTNYLTFLQNDGKRRKKNKIKMNFKKIEEENMASPAGGNYGKNSNIYLKYVCT